MWHSEITEVLQWHYGFTSKIAENDQTKRHIFGLINFI